MEPTHQPHRDTVNRKEMSIASQQRDEASQVLVPCAISFSPHRTSRDVTDWVMNVPDKPHLSKYPYHLRSSDIHQLSECSSSEGSRHLSDSSTPTDSSSFNADVFSPTKSPWRYLPPENEDFIKLWNGGLSDSLISNLYSRFGKQFLAISALHKPNSSNPFRGKVADIEVVIALEFRKKTSITFVPFDRLAERQVRRIVGTKLSKLKPFVCLSVCKVGLSDPWLLDINEKYKTVFRTRVLPRIPHKHSAYSKKQLQRFSKSGLAEIRGMRKNKVWKAVQKKRAKGR